MWIRGNRAFISPESGRWVGTASGSPGVPHKPCSPQGLPGKRALPDWEAARLCLQTRPLSLPSLYMQELSQKVSDLAADLPGGRELDQTTSWVPSNSGIPHRGLTTPMPLGCVDPQWSTESLGWGEPLLELGKGHSEVRVQKGVSHRALLSLLWKENGHS